MPEPPVFVLIQSEADVSADDSWLSPQEAGVLAGLRFPKRRTDWRLGRWTAKLAVARYLGIDRLRIRIEAAEDGAPEALVDGQPAQLTLSISHRDGIAAAAIATSGRSIGCDLERVEPRSDGFVSDYLTEAERAVVGQTLPTDRALAVTLTWSAKETVLKTLRTGLRADTREIEVAIPTAPPIDHEEWRSFLATQRATGRRFVVWWRTRGDHVLTVGEEVGSCGAERLQRPWIATGSR
jgi:4'-phosphopantetheinyl transferase